MKMNKSNEFVICGAIMIYSSNDCDIHAKVNAHHIINTNIPFVVHFTERKRNEKPSIQIFSIFIYVYSF